MASEPAEPVFDHLSRLTTPTGLFEHARLTTPRVEHGYCLDDAARALVVTCRQPAPSSLVAGLQDTYLGFTLLAQDDQGRFHNRRRADGTWTDEPSVGDHWGRAAWALGTVAATATDDAVGGVAAEAAVRALGCRSPWWHATAYAALGAADLLTVDHSEPVALAFLEDARTALSAPPVGGWRWPEARLTYASAVLPEALLAIGVALDDEATLRHGLALLGWLVALQTTGDHLSPIPVAGWAPGEELPAFDQQPIEVGALAEACARALAVTGDEAWSRLLDRCVAWFYGVNDLGLALYDPTTGGGNDGLHRYRVNQNQGAESTLAALATIQLARRAGVAVRA